MAVVVELQVLAEVLHQLWTQPQQQKTVAEVVQQLKKN